MCRQSVPAANSFSDGNISGPRINSPQSSACLMSMHYINCQCRRNYSIQQFSTLHQLGRNVNPFEEFIWWLLALLSSRMLWRARASYGILNSNSRWLVYFIRGTFCVEWIGWKRAADDMKGSAKPCRAYEMNVSPTSSVSHLILLYLSYFYGFCVHSVTIASTS